MFVESGMIEVYTELEGHEFIIERLYSGSVINYRSFFMEDIIHVNFRCKETCQILELDQKCFQNLMSEYRDFNRRIMLFQNKLL